MPLISAPPAVTYTDGERHFAEQVETWLRSLSEPSQALLWFPLWHKTPHEVPDEHHLAALIAGLPLGDWGGIQLSHRSGRWAQVKHTREEGYYFELHPYAHSPERPFVWTSHDTAFPSLAAGKVWDWVARQPLGAGASPW